MHCPWIRSLAIFFGGIHRKHDKYKQYYTQYLIAYTSSKKTWTTELPLNFHFRKWHHCGVYTLEVSSKGREKVFRISLFPDFSPFENWSSLWHLPFQTQNDGIHISWKRYVWNSPPIACSPWILCHPFSIWLPFGKNLCMLNAIMVLANLSSTPIFYTQFFHGDPNLPVKIEFYYLRDLLIFVLKWIDIHSRWDWEKNKGNWKKDIICWWEKHDMFRVPC